MLVLDTTGIVLLQVETDPLPHLLIDIRSPDAIKASPLPKELTFTALQLPVEEIDSALAGLKSDYQGISFYEKSAFL